MIELETVFCVKYKPRKETGPIKYGVLVGETGNFWMLAEADDKLISKSYYHYQRIKPEEYLDAVQNKREVSRDERDSECR